MPARSMPVAVPSALGVQDPVARQILQAITANLNALFGLSADKSKWPITRADAVSMGLLKKTLAGDHYSDLQSQIDELGGGAVGNAGVKNLTESWQMVELDARLGLDVGLHSLGAAIPVNSYITKAFYEVIAAFSSATSAATIQLGVEVDDLAGIKAATIITDGSLATGAVRDALPNWTGANVTSRTTASRGILVDVGTEALTGGRLILVFHYVTVGNLS